MRCVAFHALALGEWSVKVSFPLEVMALPAKCRRLCDEQLVVVRCMGAVTSGALSPLGGRVDRGQCELLFQILVAGQAELRLRLCQLGTSLRLVAGLAIAFGEWCVSLGANQRLLVAGVGVMACGARGGSEVDALMRRTLQVGRFVATLADRIGGFDQ